MGETFPAGSRPFLAVAPSGAGPKAKKTPSCAAPVVFTGQLPRSGAIFTLRPRGTPCPCPAGQEQLPGRHIALTTLLRLTAKIHRAAARTRSIQRRDHRRSAVRLSFFLSLSLERPGAACGKCRTRQNPRKRSMKMLLRTPAAAPANKAGAEQDPEFFLTFGPARQKRNGPEKGKSPRGKRSLPLRGLSRRTGYPHVNSFRLTARTCRAAGPYRFTPANFAVFEYAFTTQRPEVPS